MFGFWLFIHFFSIAGSLHNENFRVVNKPVGDGRGDGGAVKDFSPVGKGQIRRYDGRLFIMPAAYDLEKEI